MGSLTVTYNGKTILNLSSDAQCTLTCSGKVMETDVTLTGDNIGDLIVTYNGSAILRKHKSGTWKLLTSGKYMTSDLSISCAISPVVYIGTIAPLSVARRDAAGASIGNYALAIGGRESETVSSAVDAYSSSLVHSTRTSLSVGRTDFDSASVGNYALAMGGRTADGGYTASVEAYNTSLSRSTVPDELSSARMYLSGASVGNYALAMGGWANIRTVDAYNTSLVHSNPESLSVGRYFPAGASVGNYALAMGGSGLETANFSVVDAYNSSLERITPSPLSFSGNAVGASIKNYAIAFGRSGNINAYNESLTRIIAESYLNDGASANSCASNSKFALIFSNSPNNMVIAYDTFLTRSIPEQASALRPGICGTNAGDYLFAMGGWNNDSGYFDVVDVYKAT